MIRRSVGVVVLGLLMTMFCLVIDDRSGPPPVCKEVAKGMVWWCYDEQAERCYFTNREGRELTKPCYEHAFVGRNK